MDLQPHILPLISVLALGAFTRSALGFGDALVAMPLLVLLLPVQEAAVLGALLQLLISAIILTQSWRDADFGAAYRLIIAAAAGIPVGIYALRTLPQSTVTFVLGAMMIFFALYSLRTAHLPTLQSGRWAFLFGFVAGCLGGAYNTSGPPVVMYSACRRWSPARFRATMQGFFLPTAALVVIGHGVGGLWTLALFRTFAAAVLPVLGAIALGGWLHRRIAPARFQRIVHWAILALGMGLLWRAF